MSQAPKEDTAKISFRRSRSLSDLIHPKTQLQGLRNTLLSPWSMLDLSIRARKCSGTDIGTQQMAQPKCAQFARLALKSRTYRGGISLSISLLLGRKWLVRCTAVFPLSRRFPSYRGRS
ncbi:hypothetical protein, variant [Blastomyces gilchristii SLH14081]|uniref:Uncharacterized protein n=1 Tax=Blastomyces gilchristii (strain SLH14081) TaxID=559298 RepID=A0A179U7G7_BLAGS|nr:uncharacterized protein BDBG_16140 [Blastomyces gilchristii SLH14081]XP_031575882.1 hypothetical protein, variant [Blastomyces gilchristii SLH14081]OAT03913.1 hypothetical protein BDBG_16140 [Blastomyces gilchristii SLH14081]OAT03914.1 hypothetical protein, variant [Blastomyces gilchristii SLH14081]